MPSLSEIAWLIKQAKTPTFGLHLTQFVCILAGITGIMLISFSLDHDMRWNEWVDQHFNLNHKNSQFRPHIDDYLLVESQQQWIDKLTRHLFQDKLYLLLTITACVITILHSLSSVNTPIIGSMVYTSCSFISIVAGVCLTISILFTTDTEADVADILEHIALAKNSSLMTPSGPSIRAASMEVSSGLKKDVSCRSIEHNPAVLRHCQMYTVKIFAVIAAFVNASMCGYLVWAYLFTGRHNSIEPEAAERQRLSRVMEDMMMTDQRERAMSFPQNGNKRIASPGEEKSSTLQPGDISQLREEYRRSIRESKLSTKGRLNTAYQPQVRGQSDDVPFK